jgi:hypothetical protein
MADDGEGAILAAPGERVKGRRDGARAGRGQEHPHRPRAGTPALHGAAGVC